ncbi:hypothetical protein ACEQPO_29475 [Bacillus sp. SL00103]
MQTVFATNDRYAYIKLRFSQANFHTEDMTPAELAALKARSEEQKTALIRAIRHQLQIEFAEDRQEAGKILDLIDELQNKVYKHHKRIHSHMSGQAIDALTENRAKTQVLRTERRCSIRHRLNWHLMNLPFDESFPRLTRIY